jgi:hypothetical protein
MAKTQTTRVYNFFGKKGLGGGLNTSDDPLIVGPEEISDGNNFLIGQTLSRQKRPGLESYHTSSYASTASWPTAGSPIRKLVQYWRYASATGEVQEDLFLHSQTNVWSIDTRTSPAVNRTGSLTLSSTSVPSYQIFEGILYFTSSNTADGYNKWNGLPNTPGDATAATAPTDGVGKYLGVYYGRMVMAGNPMYPFRFYISAPYDAEDWTGPTATSIDLDYDGDPDGITAIFPELDGRLYIATRKSIYELTGTDVNSFVIRRVTRGVGCVGQGTVVATPNDVLFSSDRGVHSIKKVIVSDQSNITFLSRDVQNIWTSLLNEQLFGQMQAAWDETQNLYILSVVSSGTTTNDTVLAYNMTYGYWMKWEDIDARSLSTVLVNKKQYVIVGKEDGGIQFFNPSSSTDDGTGYSFQFKTGKFFPDGDITKEFRFNSVTALVSVTDPSTVAFGWSIDSVDSTKSGSREFSVGTDADLLGTTFILGASKMGIGRFIPIRVSIEETGYNFQLEVTCGGSSNINFHGWLLEVDDANPVYS